MKLFLTKLFDSYPQVEYPKIQVGPIFSRQKYAIDEIGVNMGVAKAATSLLVNAGVDAKWLVPEGGGEELIRRARIRRKDFYIGVEFYTPPVGFEKVIRMLSTDDSAFNVYRLNELVVKASPRLMAHENYHQGWFKRGVLIRIPILYAHLVSKHIPSWIYETIKRDSE